ncbi:hypothetical protein BJ875DRAFT_131217 [Amylocarpus encephaloides]|uniref:Uncharacterized protein n=1 Tax=Amylocarpus encephaloides TaxID=45428 RepID=A0A9P8C8R7_9HELO|nr:hypothetical protein BJ875DRAFT_131217 [Amylocarpus encephaloides]
MMHDTEQVVLVVGPTSYTHLPTYLRAYSTYVYLLSVVKHHHTTHTTNVRYGTGLTSIEISRVGNIILAPSSLLPLLFQPPIGLFYGVRACLCPVVLGASTALASSAPGRSVFRPIQTPCVGVCVRADHAEIWWVLLRTVQVQWKYKYRSPYLGKTHRGKSKLEASFFGLLLGDSDGGILQRHCSTYRTRGGLPPSGLSAAGLIT